MSVTVCVVVKDRLDLMQRCLEAILAEDPDEVVVIDNGSSDGTWEAMLTAAEREPRLRLAQDRGSLGTIRNHAVRLATSDVVAFTDSDCQPRPGWLRAGLAALTEGVGVVQGRTVPERPPTVRWSATQDISRFSGLFEACNVFFRRDVLLATSGFDEVVGFFGEDTAAGWAIERAGWSSAWAEDAVVEHVVTEPGFRWHIRRTRGYANWPALLKAFPEKRSIMWHRLFLRRRSAETDAAVLGVVVAALLRNPLPLAAALPFVWRYRPRSFSRTGLGDAAGAAAFDLAVSAALLKVSVKHRTPVL